jgi:ribulose bisphosphate carboxylase small subunit
VRLVSFDAQRQVQVAGFLVQRPVKVLDCQPPKGRSVQG